MEFTVSVKESEVAQSYLTLCDPVDCSPPGSSVHGILQARTLEWVAISFFRGSSRPGISCIASGFFTNWVIREAHSHRIWAPLSVEFSRQEYWSRLPLSSPGDFPNPGIEPGSPALQADSLPSEPRGKPAISICDYKIDSFQTGT